MIRHASPKLGGYVSLAALFLIGAQVFGRPELVALAAPFLLVLVIGLATSRQPTWTEAAVSVTPARCVEGDTISVDVDIRAEHGVDRLEVVVPLAPALRPQGRSVVRAVRLLAGEPRRVTIPIRCDRWGALEVGEVLMRASDRFDLFRFDDRIDARRRIKVFPRTETVRALVRPAQTQLRVGNQVARRTGEGIEFAELRPFVPGDRVRSVDWKATARKGSPWVRERHPERNTDVVLFLDTFSDVWAAGDASTLERSVRATLTLAGAYLGRRDRVGLIAFGGTLRWLEPAMGARHLYRIIDMLLGTGSRVSHAWKGVSAIPLRMLPARALILAVTPLLDERSITAILDLRGRGFDLAVVDVSPVPPAPYDASTVAQLAHRIWVMERRVLRRRLEGVGIAVAQWEEDRFLQRPVWEVELSRRSARPVHP